MRPGRVIALLCSAYVLAGCGATAHQQVEAKVQEFARATENRNYAALCDDVLAPALVAHLTAAGLSCEQAMRIFVSSVQNPSISVSKVTVHGSSASAVVLASATGQPAAIESIELIDTEHGWRLASLASPR
jgi:hypothetical protein